MTGNLAAYSLCCVMMLGGGTLAFIAVPDYNGSLDAYYVYQLARLLIGSIMLTIGAAALAVVMAVGNIKRE
jgi:hypothetical protein